MALKEKDKTIVESWNCFRVRCSASVMERLYENGV